MANVSLSQIEQGARKLVEAASQGSNRVSAQEVERIVEQQVRLANKQLEGKRP